MFENKVLFRNNTSNPDHRDFLCREGHSHIATFTAFATRAKKRDIPINELIQVPEVICKFKQIGWAEQVIDAFFFVAIRFSP
jgi:hypothetical protein